MRQSKYLCNSWQSLIQYVVLMITKGYYYYQIIEPKRILNQYQWIKADKRIINKFNTDVSKDIKYRNRKKGNANYTYCRYNNTALLLKSEGRLNEEYSSEIFHDIRINPIEMSIGENIILKINKSRNIKSWTIYLSRQSYKNIKTELLELLEHRKIRELEYRFTALNNIPGYTGINEQKIRLKKFIISKAKSYGIIINKDKLWIGFKRTTYQVFSDEKEINID